MLLDEAGDVAKDENFIREQWRAQVKEQTRPSPSKRSLSPSRLILIAF